jgi:hypothetical protein
MAITYSDAVREQMRACIEMVRDTQEKKYKEELVIPPDIFAQLREASIPSTGMYPELFKAGPGSFNGVEIKVGNLLSTGSKPGIISTGKLDLSSLELELKEEHINALINSEFTKYPLNYDDRIFRVNELKYGMICSGELPIFPAPPPVQLELF